MPSLVSVAEQSLQTLRPLVEAALERLLQQAGGPPQLVAAMRYSLVAESKRLRPILVLLAAEACGGEVRSALPAASAIEMVHTYSLIHDDLPAMDDDELRRGQPACHIAHGEAMAILAGDALLTRAFEVLAEEIQPAETAAACCALLASAAGADGMVGGQSEDLAAADTAANNIGSLEALEKIHRLKTGRLMTCSLELGVCVAGGSEEQRKSLVEYGFAVGLAFQIADDLLDVEGDIQQTGKTAGRDRDLGKLTYPALLGVEHSRRRARQLVDSACRALEPLGESADALRGLAEFMIERDH